ncbi:hypothetical protein [Archangium sp.]|uniref:hypothetical protein n=1 Tax=Archangium sp. TaxID=1872627 RepID=UPI002D64FD45|nr:hypothetical protein [Archangium sp.]HYO54150.1 hypothetical protein [Archangium sp.]
MGSSLRILLFFCISLGLASPALANSLPDALCGTASGSVAQMATSEKLCRSFALGLAEVPHATLQEAQALLTPENLAAMSALTGIWLASQGVPVVGEAVDAALATLGIILLTAQVADLSNALWQYALLATTARSLDELKTASVHLARAVALVGVNVVTFILTAKVSSKVRKQPPPREPSLQPATQPDPLRVELSGRHGGSSIHPDAVAAHQAKPPTAATAAAEGAVASTSKVFAVNALVKRINPTAFKRWLADAPRRPATGDDLAKKFQRAHAGEEELLVQGEVHESGPTVPTTLTLILSRPSISRMLRRRFHEILSHHALGLALLRRGAHPAAARTLARRNLPGGESREHLLLRVRAPHGPFHTPWRHAPGWRVHPLQRGHS